MIKIHDKLFVGSIEDLKGKEDKEWAFVHATKSIYKTIGNPQDYLFHEDENRLFLNWIDAEEYEYFDWREEGVSVVERALDFIERWLPKRKVLIHCDKGESRGPSLGMTYLAKRVQKSGSYKEADSSFYDVYENYNPGAGISLFLFLKWDEIK